LTTSVAEVNGIATFGIRVVERRKAPTTSRPSDVVGEFLCPLDETHSPQTWAPTSGKEFDVKINLRRVGAVIGLFGMAAIGLLYFFSTLLAPTWAVVVLCALWLGMAVLCVRWFSSRPLVVLAMPVIAYAIWFVALTLGDEFLGWTA
jgi:hypothetical protein